MSGSRTFVGVDLGGTFVKTALVDQTGRILKRSSIPTDAEAGVPKVLGRIQEAVRAVLDSSALGIGIGTPGLVNSKAGEVSNLANFKGWDHVPLASEISAAFSLPSFLDNDGNVMALAECLWGAGKGAQSLVGITLGTGVGGGFVAAQMPYQTWGLSAVEIGHIVVVHDGPACACGGKGCLERFVGNRFIVERFLERLDKGHASRALDLVQGRREALTPEILSQAADQGDVLSQDIWRETGEYVGSALITAINLLAPEVIAVGGGVAKAGDKLLQPMRAWVDRHAIPVLAKACRIVPASLGNDAGVVGAACLAMQSLVSPAGKS